LCINSLLFIQTHGYQPHQENVQIDCAGKKFGFGQIRKKVFAQKNRDNWSEKFSVQLSFGVNGVDFIVELWKRL
jgi:hypothetical protein